MTKAEPAKKVERTSAGLRDALFDELDGLRDGSINPTKANATAKIASTIVDTVSMELAVYKAMSKQAAPSEMEDTKLPFIQLGHAKK